MPTLLILDRERRSRRQLYSLLATRFNVVAIHGIFSALRLLRRHTPDVVVVKTSGMDAFAMALLKWVQQQGLHVPTIVLLGRGAGHGASAARQLGAGAVLRWPLDRPKLLGAVAAATNGLPHSPGRVPGWRPPLPSSHDDGLLRAGRYGAGVRTWPPALRPRPHVLRRA
jgi:DNA-binding NtrC family response regulator